LIHPSDTPSIVNNLNKATVCKLAIIEVWEENGFAGNLIVSGKEKTLDYNGVVPGAGAVPGFTVYVASMVSAHLPEHGVNGANSYITKAYSYVVLSMDLINAEKGVLSLKPILECNFYTESELSMIVSFGYKNY